MAGYFIESLNLRNFKSIKNLEINPSRVNLFIGEPNTGKSNILEALGVASLPARRNANVKDFVRYEYLSNLFYDDLINISPEIIFDDNYVKIMYSDGKYLFDGYSKAENKSKTFKSISADGKNTSTSEFLELEKISKYIKFYRFNTDIKQSKTVNSNDQYLAAPNGHNLFSVVYHNSKYRKIVSNLMKEFDYTLHLRPHEQVIEFQKMKDESIVSFPFSLLSDTVKQIIFHIIAIESNENSILTFEEPESHTFPYYTKLLGEKIAVDSNQYFIVTHNPYFLTGIVEKIPVDEIGIFVTYTKNYETNVKELQPSEIEELLDYDPFLNLNKFYEV